MVLKSDSRAQHFNLLQGSTPSQTSVDFLTNCQRWQISRKLDHDHQGAPIFHLKDDFGMDCTVKEFIVEDLDLEFREELSQLSSAEEQQKLICQYLQTRLNQATSYQVHVERHEHQLFIRFGAYGLKGGMQGNGNHESTAGKAGALILSATQVGVGLLCSAMSNNPAKLLGAILISSGFSSGRYACQQDKEKKFNVMGYAKYLGYGALTGTISGGVGWAASSIANSANMVTLTCNVANSIASIASGIFQTGAVSRGISVAKEWGANNTSAIIKVASQPFGGILNNVAAIVAVERYEKKQWPKAEDIRNQAATGFIGGLCGAVIGAGVGGVVGQSTKETDAWIHALKKMAEGSTSAAASKVATNWWEEKDYNHEVLQSALLGGVIAGCIGGIEQAKKIHEFNQAKQKIGETQKGLQEAQAQKAKDESTLKTLQETLRQSEQALAEKKVNIERLQKNLQGIQKQASQNEQEMREAQKTASMAKEKLHAALQEMTEAQQTLARNQQSVSEAQKSADSAGAQIQNAEQMAQQAKYNYDELVRGIDKDIRRHLKKGYKAKVNGHYTKNGDKIRDAYLRGGKIGWKKGQNHFFGDRETIRTRPNPLLAQYQDAQARVQQAGHIMNELQSSIEQKLVALKTAQERLGQHQHLIDQTQAELQATQNVQSKEAAAAKMAQDQLKSSHLDLQRTQQEIDSLQKTIESLNQQKIDLEQHLHNDSSQESSPELSKELQEAIEGEYQSYLKLHQDYEVRDALNQVVQPPVSVSYSECNMNELISHVVLVHAECHDNGYRYYPDEFDWSRVETEGPSYSVLYTLQKLITSDGTIAHHLDMEKRQFAGKFETRPQMHWAWNQLVQPNSGAPLGGWEDATIGVLETLSALENSPYKPFAVAPYDTQTFEPVQLSEKSTILVPNAIFAQAKAHLKDFQGEVIGYDSDSKKLRTVIVETLSSERYPETWHVCDENGQPIGHQSHYTTSGYNAKTCLTTKDGKIHILLANEGVKDEQQLSPAMKEYHHGGRRISLHCNSTTYWLEDKPFFLILKEAEKNKEIIKNCPLFFAANIQEVCLLSSDKVNTKLAAYQNVLGDANKRGQTSYTAGVLEAFHFYQRMAKDSAPQTGSYIIAHYVLKEAIYADLISLFFQKYPGEDFKLSVPELRLIIDPILPRLKKVLKQVKKHVDRSEQEKALEGFDYYRTFLQACLVDALRSKEEADNALRNAGASSNMVKVEFDIDVAQAKWNAVEVPPTIEFNWRTSWPFSPQLQAYIEAIIPFLPTDIEQLKSLHYNLRSSSPDGINNDEDKRKLYLLNILCSFTQSMLQARLYQKLRNTGPDISPLVRAFIMYRAWLQEHHLVVRDATRKIGDCLFDNVIAQTSDIPYKTADDLRKAVVKFLRDNTDQYQSQPEYHPQSALEIGDGGKSLPYKNWDSYLACIATPQVWATELEMHALSILLNRPIVLVSGGVKPKIYNPQGLRAPVLLNHKNENHYESCMPTGSQALNEVYQRILDEPHY